MYVYLFEAKSIQTYLFRSGRLKDVISASERLDRLVDDDSGSVLAQVLHSAGLKSDLLESVLVSDQVIGFTRCKGGAFYAYCEQREPLLTLRSLWTLTVQQLFPGLEFADALTQGETLAEAMDAGHPALAASRNCPTVKFPLATAPCDHAPRTGLAAVPLSAAAKTEVKSSEKDERIDLDTEHHRQGYRLLRLRKEPLLHKFITSIEGDKQLPDSLNFPLNMEDFPAFNDPDEGHSVVKDLALIHIDGNGLGLLLRSLQGALKGIGDQEYGRAFRTFSSALARATQQAAFQASYWLYQEQKRGLDAGCEPDMLAMRPIVLGGDDITLFCQADLALGYAETFCIAFKSCSERELAPLYHDYLQGTPLKPYLTASGGILYHKATHPFTTCHNLVEGLCKEAKQLTQSLDSHVGPAAISFYRLSHALAEDIVTLRTQSQQFLIEDRQLLTSIGGYLVEDKTQNNAHKTNTYTPSLSNLKQAITLLRDKRSSLSIAKFRQMATELARGDMDEAERIYERAYEQLSPATLKEWQTILASLFPKADTPNWYWNNKSWLSDLLTIAHFLPQSTTSVTQGSKK
ncbi:Uncharacterised protein [Shewanella putrefaciens]|uniref:Cas10/Cmr2 second palm domain-containing protein n=1 Tax=Shewanella decolorationis TaxID=256839 RepID=A0A5B8QY07_9GAMM|nr:hypothetical protein [Shewanella decolorationis]QDZ90846.1 hypothetical protein D0436_10405 [Shewanella decolorationis]VEE64267.1 Uncharacterised protein [Shewanella putrefaciens]